MISSVMTLSLASRFVMASITPIGTVNTKAKMKRVLNWGRKRRIKKIRQHTDQEGKHESPYRKIRIPHLDNNDTGYKHDH